MKTTRSRWGISGHVFMSRAGYVTYITVDNYDRIGSVHLARWPSGESCWMALVERSPATYAYMRSFDHAVMWILRRAKARIWQQERPVVYRVRHCRCLEGHWRVLDPAGGLVAEEKQLSEAFRTAHQKARAEVASIFGS